MKKTDYLGMLQKAKNYNRDQTQTEAMDRLKYYKALTDEDINKDKADPINNKKTAGARKYENAKNINTNDCANIVRTIMPEILEVFLTSTSINVNTEVPEVKKFVEEYNRKNIFKNRNYVAAIAKAIKSALVFNKGIIKVILEEKVKHDCIPMLSEVDTMQAIQEMQAGAPVKLVQTEDENLVKVCEVFRESKPDFYFVNYDDFLYVPDHDDIIQCSFVANRIEKTKSYFLNKAESGEFENVDKINWESASLTNSIERDSMKLDRDNEQAPYYAEDDKQENAKLYEMYECYTIEPDEITGDMEHYIVNIAGGQILRKYKNPWGERPFGVFCIDYGINNIEPEALVDWLKDIQKLKTNVSRQWLDNLIKTNNQRPLVSPKALANGDIKLSSFLNNVPGSPFFAELGTIDFNASRIPNIGKDPIEGLQYLDNLSQDITGINKYVQGQTSTSLNKTATGIRTLLGQSQKRIRMMIRIMVETGFVNILNTLTAMYKYMEILDPEGYLESETGMGYTDDESEVQKLLVAQPLYEKMIAANNRQDLLIPFTKKIFEKLNLPTSDLFPENLSMNQQQMMAMQMAQQNQGISGMNPEQMQEPMTQEPMPDELMQGETGMINEPIEDTVPEQYEEEPQIPSVEDIQGGLQ